MKIVKISRETFEIVLAFIIMISVTLGIGYLAEKESEYYKHQTEEINNMKIADSRIEEHIANNFFIKSPQDGLMDALIFYNIEHPEIVYAQAVLESGLGKSYVYKRTNNLFGLYNSYKHDYHEFDHWSKSVLGYKHMIQRRYNHDENYYDFLNRIGYAGDPNYNDKLRKIIYYNL